MTNCILCHSDDTEIIQEVKQDDINALCRKVYGIDTSYLITSDLLYHHCKGCVLRFFTAKDSTIPTGDNNFYNTLTGLDWYYFSEKHEYHFAKQYLNKDSKVLEAGCGKAAFAHFLPQKSKTHYVGLEFNTQAKELAAKHGILIENIPIEEYAKRHAHNFDVACSFQVLEHVSNPHSFISAQIQCLKDSQVSVGGGA